MNATLLYGPQLQRYGRYHQSRSNLLLHIVFVPLFLVSNVVCLVCLAEHRWLIALAAVALMGLSLSIQGRGHGKEPVSPEAFTGPFNAISRLMLEQWVTFPRFLLSGAWRQALRNSSALCME